MRFLRWLLVIVVGLILIPPFWYALFPERAPELPPPGTTAQLASGNAVNVLDEGEGPVVVLVHGLPGSAYDWRELTPLLNEAGLRTIAYDRVGYGRSPPRAVGTFTLRSNGADLDDLLDAMDLQDVTVVGWSYGGALAMQAADDPRIARIVLVGTGGPSSDDFEPPERAPVIDFLYSMPVLRWRNAVPPVSRALQAALSDEAFSGGVKPDWWLDSLSANFQRWDTVLTYRNEIFADFDPTAIEPRAIDTPTLIIHAEDDRLASVQIGRYLAQTIPGAEYREVPGASHMLPITHAPLLTQLISQFVGPPPAAEPAPEPTEDAPAEAGVQAVAPMSSPVPMLAPTVETGTAAQGDGGSEGPD
ncbi:MAG TPA: alpha/beta hydrolase [Pseudomonadales bacterium]|nr:alpha/beta hydrolase [Pseudomonadales bacterium]